MRVTQSRDPLPSLSTGLRNEETTGSRLRQTPAPVPPEVAKPVEATQPVDTGQVKAAIEAANRALESKGAEMAFAMDSDTGRVVVKLIDRDTQKILRQFPSEEMLRIAKYIEEMQSVGIDQKA